MPLPTHWATPEDFATLFQYFWHRDFPASEEAVGARRTDWTMHTAIVVRNIADLMGLFARFERGGRKDAILRSGDGDEVAIEWEWQGVWGANELGKLKTHKVWKPKESTKTTLEYAVLITYTHTPNIEKVEEKVREEWEGTPWPLLLILIDLEETKKFLWGKDFKHLNVSVFDAGEQNILRRAPAFPWNVESSRWTTQRI